MIEVLRKYLVQFLMLNGLFVMAVAVHAVEYSNFGFQDEVQFHSLPKDMSAYVIPTQIDLYDIEQPGKWADSQVATSLAALDKLLLQTVGKERHQEWRNNMVAIGLRTVEPTQQAEPRSMELDQIFPTVLFTQLNQKAAKLWNELLQCTGPENSKVLQAYLRKEICKSQLSAIAKFQKKELMQFFLSYNIEVGNLLPGFHLGSSSSLSGHSGLKGISEIALSSMEMKSNIVIHPLLPQTLLEFLATLPLPDYDVETKGSGINIYVVPLRCNRSSKLFRLVRDSISCGARPNSRAKNTINKPFGGNNKFEGLARTTEWLNLILALTNSSQSVGLWHIESYSFLNFLENYSYFGFDGGELQKTLSVAMSIFSHKFEMGESPFAREKTNYVSFIHFAKIQFLNGMEWANWGRKYK